MPHGLSQRLPKEFCEAANNWICSGAAVCTALDRVRKMEDEAVNRADPVFTHKHLLNWRRALDAASSVISGETPPMSTPSTLTSSMVSSFSHSTSGQPIQPFPQHSVKLGGIKSSSYTPVDSVASCSPVISPTEVASNLDSITADVYSLSSQDLLSMKALDTPVRNEIAWEYYVGSFNAEVDDLKRRAMPCLKGYTRTIIRVYAEITRERNPSHELRTALRIFGDWWSVMEPQVGRYQEKVDDLERKEVATDM